MRSLIVFSFIIMLVGCGEESKVSVTCETTATPSVECEVTQTAGTREVTACWDFEVTCANGAVVKAERTCQAVSGGGTTRATISADRLSGLDGCAGDEPPVGALSNLTLDGEPSR